jgi:DNA-binding transcriptional ArsR family regulator
MSAGIDKIIHSPARLRIMSILSALDRDEEVDFTFLKSELNLTDGNLGGHLIKLEEAKYIRVNKAFVGRKPKSFVSATNKGRAAFEDHVAALKEIIGDVA